MLAIDLAVTNLLDNAVKFTPPGGQVTVTLRNEPTRVILRVEDTGMGIPAEAHEKIFLPFYRVDSSLSGSGQGNGIGLTLVQHIAEAHGGQVNMRSVPGQGSVFTLVLPRHQAT
jgi:signal transduction histidine kinase